MLTKASATLRELPQMLIDVMADEVHHATHHPYGLVHALAWPLNALLVIALCISAATMASDLDGSATSHLCQGWLLSGALAFALLEPASVLLLAALRAAASAGASAGAHLSC